MGLRKKLSRWMESSAGLGAEFSAEASEPANAPRARASDEGQAWAKNLDEAVRSQGASEESPQQSEDVGEESSLRQHELSFAQGRESVEDVSASDRPEQASERGCSASEPGQCSSNVEDLGQRARIERLKSLIAEISARRGFEGEVLRAFDEGRALRQPMPEAKSVGLLPASEIVVASRALEAARSEAEAAAFTAVLPEPLTPFTPIVSRPEHEDASQEEAGAWRVGPRAVLPGAREETAFGPVRRVSAYLEPHHCHGRARVAAALEAPAAVLAGLARDPALASVEFSRALFVDTETTGLSLGAGTIPFLIGMARFEDQSLVVEQLLLEALPDEPAVLELLRARLESASCLVTYNGKSYDWPLLESRFVLHRLRPPPRRPHLDLLHAARRIYKRRLGGARLVQLESEVLGMHRERDVDGAEIPALYWSFLRERTAVLLAPVIEHNANDLIALVALLGALASRYLGLHPEDDPRDQLGLAELAARASDAPRALAFAWAVAEGGAARDHTVEACLLAAELHRRAGELERSETALLRAVESAGHGTRLAAPAHLALAKLYEHQRRAFELALEHATAAASFEGEAGAARRRSRLESKLARRAAESCAPPRRRGRLRDRTQAQPDVVAVIAP